MVRTRRIFTIGLVAGMVMGAGTAAQERQAPPVYPAAQAPPAFRPAVQHADLIIVSLQNALLSELHRRLEDVGPAVALNACHMAAIPVAQRAGRYEGSPSVARRHGSAIQPTRRGNGPRRLSSATRSSPKQGWTGS